ncbi:hypothetical protein E0485_03770 [Paenibacillus albiflavus]|uniref:Endolytic transglycosylase MltG n=1 Tax=Paenibacillus albiflavus TaxID=2545760 RepID=A0A4R4EJ73_9BACL|nr:hypothetical protein [Paenibacillus albiflavus]TCZ79989.1 hypothetical protein E0485_03770 [Paenibacillus albiflavus]
MNRKQLWIGIGVGMIIGALLLQLMLLVPRDSEAMNSENQASSNSNKVYSEEEFNQKLQTRLQEELDKQPKPTPEPSVNPTPTPAPEISKQTVIFVAYRATSDDVVKMLASTELINDSDAFMKELVKRKLTNKIRTGVHTFNGSPTIDEIIDNLVKPNN